MEIGYMEIPITFVIDFTNNLVSSLLGSYLSLIPRMHQGRLSGAEME